jgi:hypothetical protein
MRLIAGLTLLAALAFAGGSSAQANPTLFGTVGPGFSIRVADGAGNRVTQIPPGTYTVVVKDLATEHNFHLTGPGVEMSTDVDATGTFTWTVTFGAGTYHYQCDPHATIMKGDIAVQAGAPLPAPGPATTTETTTTTTTTATPPPPPPIRRLAAVVGARSIALRTSSGAKVVRLKAGPVVIGVSDVTSQQNFHLVGPGVNRRTTLGGTLKASWRVTLRRGTYVYRSDAAPLRLRGTFRVV